MTTQNINVNFQSEVGPGSGYADGTRSDAFRIGKFRELITAHAHGRHFEAASRGKIYCACNPTAVTFGTSLTATGVTFHLTNPLGSGHLLSVLTCGVTMITSTTAGSIVYAANINMSAAAVVHGTPLTVYNAKLGGASGVGLADAACTLPAAPVAIRTLCGGFTTNANSFVQDNVDGAICLQPGTAISLQGITIVGTGLFSMFWEEVPIP